MNLLNKNFKFYFLNRLFFEYSMFRSSPIGSMPGDL